MAQSVSTASHLRTANPISHVAHTISKALTGWPPQLISLALILAVIITTVVLHYVLVRIIPNRLLDKRPLIATLVRRTNTILFFVIGVVLFAGVVPAMPVGHHGKTVLLHILSAAFIALVGCSAIVAIDIFTSLKLSHRPDDIQANVMARRQATQWQVLRRVSRVLSVVITIAATLMVFPAVRQYGVSLLASAGAAALVVGLAARPVLSNLIAGIQIAITQPFRVEDAVVINGQWGWIEEITSTYVVVRIWNWQRMVVPLAWLLANPFQNWTRENSELIGSVHWSVDYTIPVDALRKKLDEIVHSSKLWSGKVVVLQVTHALPTTITLRALVSARNSGEAWDLRCYVREKMIEFMQAEYPGALPKQRVEIEGQPVETDAVSEGN